MKRFHIECGVGRPSTPNAMAMNVSKPGKNINLRVDYITRAMLKNVPDLLIDLLEIAAYIYCADQRLGRGSPTLTNFGEDWRRSMNFVIPVRHPETWLRRDVLDCLEETLGFLSDDSYSFDFRRTTASGRLYDAYFPNLLDTSMEHDEVVLFSGGIDSFAGAVDDLVAYNKSLTLVGHYSSTKVRSVQDTLIDELKKRDFARSVSYIPVWVCNEGEAAREYTQRTRSFLFACLGFIVGQLSGKDRFSFYENGVVSINLPIAGDVIGGRATRTTHPRVLRGLERLFSLLLDRAITIRTPLQWLTKKEVILKIQESGMIDLLAATNSCTRPRMWTGKQRHCGGCSQCIDRRFAILAAKMEKHDPAEHYMRDLLLADRSADPDMRMALSYVSFFQKVGSTPRERFLVDFPETVSALDKFPDLTAGQAGDRLYDLFQRHAQAVEGVVADALTRHFRALYRNELPMGSLLANCFNRARIEANPASDYDAQAKAFIDRLAAPLLEFAIDADGQRVVFRGGVTLEGTNFRCVHTLLGGFRDAKAGGREVPFMSPPTLASHMQITEQAMRQQVRRLRSVLDPLVVSLGIPLDQNSFIESKERAGYRLNPALREIHLADIRAAVAPPAERA